MPISIATIFFGPTTPPVSSSTEYTTPSTFNPGSVTARDYKIAAIALGCFAGAAALSCAILFAVSLPVAGTVLAVVAGFATALCLIALFQQKVTCRNQSNYAASLADEEVYLKTFPLPTPAPASTSAAV